MGDRPTLDELKVGAPSPPEALTVQRTIFTTLKKEAKTDGTQHRHRSLNQKNLAMFIRGYGPLRQRAQL